MMSPASSAAATSGRAIHFAFIVAPWSTNISGRGPSASGT